MPAHPLRAAIPVWADDPEAWQWQERAKGSNTWHDKHPSSPPAIHLLESFCFRLVPREWADDPDSVEVWYRSHGKTAWKLQGSNIEDFNHREYEFDIRAKPRIITLPAREIPAPLRVEDGAFGLVCWLANPGANCWANRVTLGRWSNYKVWIKRGLLYATKEDAIAAAKAMIALA